MTEIVPLVAGNWKMNGTKDTAKELTTNLAGKYKDLAQKPFDMLLCPPFTLIDEVASLAKNSGLLVGAQDCSSLDAGAHTGDVSALMLKDVGASFVILGHSERRTNHSESNELIKQKAEKALAEGLNVIICVGETEEQREKDVTLDVIRNQLEGSIPESATASNTVIAYEPVWAIGTGRTPTDDDVAEVHTYIREELKKVISLDDASMMRILYGGSVKPSNAKELLSVDNVNGALVGGASLKAEDFWAIAEAYLGKDRQNTL